MITINSTNFPQGSSLPIGYKNRSSKNKLKVFSLKLWLLAKIGIIVWAIWFVISPFIYIDIFNMCFIKIYPSVTEFNNRTIKNSLTILKNVQPVQYNKICSQVQTINPNIGCGGIHGGCYYSNQKNTIYVNTPVDNLAITSMVIVHETCHLYQHLDGRPASEEECYAIGDRVIKNLVVF